MYTASNLGYPPPKITAMKDDKVRCFARKERCPRKRVNLLGEGQGEPKLIRANQIIP